jgi:hypothetical protein
LRAGRPAVAAPHTWPYRGGMVRLLLMIAGLVVGIVFVFAIVGFVVGFVVKGLFFGLLILGVLALFGMFRAGRRSARGSRQ